MNLCHLLQRVKVSFIIVFDWNASTHLHNVAGTNQCDPDAMLSLRGSASSIAKSSGRRGIFPIVLCWLLMAVLKVI